MFFACKCTHLGQRLKKKGTVVRSKTNKTKLSHFFLPDFLSFPSILRTPRAIACAMPKCGTLRAHSGLKWSVRQILPPRYIWAVLPSNSGKASSGEVVGYVTGICCCKLGRGRTIRRFILSFLSFEGESPVSECCW